MPSPENEKTHEERFVNACAKASDWCSNAISENHHMLGNLETEYGLEYGTLDLYRLDR